MTLLLTRSQVSELIDERVLLDAIREGFRARQARAVVAGQRAGSLLPGPGTVTVLFPGLSDAIPAYTVKVHAKFPAASPAIRGVVKPARPVDR